MTDEQSQALYSRRERFIDAFLAASLVACAVAGRSEGLAIDVILAAAVQAWDHVAATGRGAMEAAGLLPFERVEP